MVKENAVVKDVKQAYKECAQLRAQWNIFNGVVRRLENDLCLAHGNGGFEVAFGLLYLKQSAIPFVCAKQIFKLGFHSFTRDFPELSICFLNDYFNFSADLDGPYEGGWSECCIDQLRVVANELFTLLNVSAHLLDVRAVAVYTTVHAVSSFASQGIGVEAVPIVEAASVSPTVEQIAQSLLSLEIAVQHFGLFCTLPVPKLQVKFASVRIY